MGVLLGRAWEEGKPALGEIHVLQLGPAPAEEAPRVSIALGVQGGCDMDGGVGAAEW